ARPRAAEYHRRPGDRTGAVGDRAGERAVAQSGAAGVVERPDAGLVIQPAGRVVLAGHPELAAVRIERHPGVVAPAGAGRAAAVAALRAGAVEHVLALL